MSDIIIIAGESLSKKFLYPYFHGNNIIKIKNCLFSKYTGFSHKIEFRSFVGDGLVRSLKFHRMIDAREALQEIIEFMKGE